MVWIQAGEGCADDAISTNFNPPIWHMKFLPSEHKDIKEAIEQSLLPAHAFTFVKRHGRLYIQFAGHTLPFIFFRKEEVYLDPQRQWQKRHVYYTGKGVHQKTIHSWAGVMAAFRSWLGSIPVQNTSLP